MDATQEVPGPDPGLRIRLARRSHLLTGAALAFLCYLSTKSPFSYLVTPYTVLEFAVTVYRNDVLLRNLCPNLSPLRRGLLVGLGPSLYYTALQMIPINLRMLILMGFTHYVLGLPWSWWSWVRSDKPFDGEDLDLRCRIDECVAFVGAGMLFFAPKATKVLLRCTLGVPWELVGWVMYLRPEYWVDLVAAWGLSWWQIVLAVLGMSLLASMIRTGLYALGSGNVMWWKLVAGSRGDFLEVMGAALFLVPAAARQVYEFVEMVVCDILPSGIQRGLYRYQRSRAGDITERYQYEPLERNSIRLLEVNRGYSGAIEATVVAVSCAPGAQYEALSYHCRNPSSTESVVINGRLFDIPSEAWAVIQSRSSIFHRRRLWAYDVCVNQKDEMEKAEQVELMPQIYRNALRVLAIPNLSWDARLAAKLMYKLVMQGPFQPHTLRDATYLDMFQDDGPWYMPWWQSMIKHLDAEYFRAPWTLSALSCGNDRIEFCMGGVYVSAGLWFDALQRLAWLPKISVNSDVTGQLFFDDLYWRKTFAYFAILISDRVHDQEYVKKDELKKFGIVLHMSALVKVDDGRDRVFAAYTSGDDVERGSPRAELVRPRYDLSLDQVYFNAGRSIILNDEPSMHLLTFAGIGWFRESTTNPSWVPSVPRKLDRVPFVDPLRAVGRFSAGGTIAVKAGLTTDPRVLSILGVRYTQIREVGRRQIFEANHWGLCDQVNEFINEALAMTRLRSLFRVLPYERIFTADSVSGITPDDLLEWNDIVGQRVVYQRSTFWQRFSGTAPAVGYAGPAHDTYLNPVVEACQGRRFAVASTGDCCLVPPLTEPGDWIYIMDGLQTPFILRETSSPQLMHLVGEAFVEGIMNGELTQQFDYRDKLREVFIV